MSLFSLIAVLLLEQYRSLEIRNQILLAFVRYAKYVEHNLNAGEQHHGIIAWIFVVIPLIFLTAIIYFLLYRLSPIVAWLWNVAVLYLTMGFRQFSHAFTQISVALEAGEVQMARNLLAKWQEKNVDEYTSNDIARVAIEQGLINSHVHVFGTILWFLLLPGPTGALLYRVSHVLAQKWGRRAPALNHFGRFAERMFVWLDWLPQRLTAITFAIVGDFQGAMDCWRLQAKLWLPAEYGIILASGAGALGVKLGEPVHEIGGELQYRPSLGLGDEADADYMHSTIGLIWRALVLWILLILMFTLVSWVSVLSW